MKTDKKPGETQTKWIVELNIQKYPSWFGAVEFKSEEEAMMSMIERCNNLEGDVHRLCIGNQIRVRKTTETIIATATAE